MASTEGAIVSGSYLSDLLLQRLVTEAVETKHLLSNLSKGVLDRLNALNRLQTSIIDTMFEQFVYSLIISNNKEAKEKGIVLFRLYWIYRHLNIVLMEISSIVLNNKVSVESRIGFIQNEQQMIHSSIRNYENEINEEKAKKGNWLFALVLWAIMIALLAYARNWITYIGSAVLFLLGAWAVLNRPDTKKISKLNEEIENLREKLSKLDSELETVMNKKYYWEEAEKRLGKIIETFKALPISNFSELVRNFFFENVYLEQEEFSSKKGVKNIIADIDKLISEYQELNTPVVSSELKRLNELLLQD